jgi:rod shape-determining protein MreD
VRTVLVVVVMFLLGIAAQGAVVHTVAPMAVVPDCIAILVVLLAVKKRSAAGAVGAFLLGLGGDLASARYLGPNAAGSVLAYCFAVAIANRVYTERGVSLALLTVVCSVVKTAAALLMVFLHTKLDIFSADVLNGVVLEAVLSGALAPMVVRIARIDRTSLTHAPFLPLR